MGINTQTNEFLTALVELVQSSGLPVVNVRLCLDLVRAQLADAECAAIEQEKQWTKQSKMEQKEGKK